MIQIKAKQQNVSFEKNVEKLAYVLSAHLYNTLDSSKVIEEAAKRSGISVASSRPLGTQQAKLSAPGQPKVTTCLCPALAVCDSASAPRVCRT